MELNLYQKLFDHIKTPVIVFYSSTQIECNRAVIDLLKGGSLSEVVNFPALREIIVEAISEGVGTHFKNIIDLQGNMLFLEISLSRLSETQEIHLIELKLLEGKSLYDEITFVSAHNHELFNNYPDAIIILDNQGKIVDINDSFVRLFGFSRLEIIGRELDELIVPESQRVQSKALFKRVLNQERVEITLKRQTKDLSVLDVHVIAYPVVIDKRITGNYVIYQDMTQVKKAEKLLHEKEDFLEQLFNRSLFPIAILDETEIVLDVNLKFEELFGYTRKDTIGKHINDLVVPQGYEDEALNFKTVILDNQTMITKTTRKHMDGTLLEVEAVGSPVLIGGRVRGFFAMYRDIRNEQEAISNLKALINTDLLTGLYSRKFIYEAIEHRLKTALKKSNVDPINETNETFALIYLDLDDFKKVNDTYGHETGDILLIEVAKRLNNALGENTYVSRIGGDEFLALVEGVSIGSIEFLRAELREELMKPFCLNGFSMNAEASIGISCFPADGSSIDELISAADVQMYEEKKLRRIKRYPNRINPEQFK